ncbi:MULTISPECIES: hypothetical protein [Bradyrhizobium]|uniref:Uncharacterized protein n=1 Tax=Bradyrhizobium yuanmingense TaxID=108015 RepID=A0A1C3XAY7_9BRAD|nr:MULTISPECIES: hypothetical protein [Bradyrhizobium]MCA1383758.1 hypothetical protein [Bradyrhizobium sp. BRP05]MCA1377990.1 hypothetical protein [Bradyrhizobium sp. IC4060]MCA1474450.1 hypothetical protein [Bradyrhizobium sp. NBAIM08]MCA1488205.1 hypothetical protein [Bradyrhizobium sp. IC4061]MCA1523922.1 hypothetical protein [Bradyrhizobium yuanmingense]
MSKGHPKAVDHPPIITVGELIDELCRLPDTAIVHFRCPMFDQELTFYRLRRRSKDAVEIAVNAYPDSPPVVPSSDPAFHTRRHSASAPLPRDGAALQKTRG